MVVQDVLPISPILYTSQMVVISGKTRDAGFLRYMSRMRT